MEVDTKELIERLKRLKEKLENEGGDLFTEDDEWTLAIAIACFETIEEQEGEKNG